MISVDVVNELDAEIKHLKEQRDGLQKRGTELLERARAAEARVRELEACERGPKACDAEIEDLKQQVDRRRYRARDAIGLLRESFKLRADCNMVEDAAADACAEVKKLRDDLEAVGAAKLAVAAIEHGTAAHIVAASEGGGEQNYQQAPAQCSVCATGFHVYCANCSHAMAEWVPQEPDMVSKLPQSFELWRHQPHHERILDQALDATQTDEGARRLVRQCMMELASATVAQIVMATKTDAAVLREHVAWCGPADNWSPQRWSALSRAIISVAMEPCNGTCEHGHCPNAKPAVLISGKGAAEAVAAHLEWLTQHNALAAGKWIGSKGYVAVGRLHDALENVTFHDAANVVWGLNDGD